MKMNVITVLWLAVVSASANAQFTPSGRDPRNATPRPHVAPTPAVVVVEHVEYEPATPSAAKRLAEAEAKLASASAADKPKIEAEIDGLLKRGIMKVSGYMAVMADGQGRFNDRAPTPTYYLVGTAEIKASQRESVKRVEIGDFLLMPEAQGGEAEGRQSAYCVAERPVNVIERPNWWVDREVTFRPPWEVSDSKSLKLPAEWQPGLVDKTSAYPDADWEVTVKVVNNTKAAVKAARLTVRLIDEKGHTVAIIDALPKAKEGRPRPPEKGQGDATLGSKAIKLDVDRNAIVIEKVPAGDAARVPFKVRLADARATVRVEVVATHLEQ